MSEQHDIRNRNEIQFRQIALRVLKQAGFEGYFPEKKPFLSAPPQGLLKKDENIYCLETFYSRRELYTSRAILNTAENLIQHSKKNGYLPLIVVGGVLPPVLRGDIVGKSILTVILDIENLLYMAQENRALYDELVAQLPYAPDGLDPREPDYLPLPDWNGASNGRENWKSDTLSPAPDFPGTAAPKKAPGGATPIKINFEQLMENLKKHTLWTESSDNPEEITEELPQVDCNGDGHVDLPVVVIEDISGSMAGNAVPVYDLDDWVDEWDGAGNTVNCPEMPSTQRPLRDINGPFISGTPGIGKSSFLTRVAFEMLQKECQELREEIRNWQGGKETSSSDYEKLCTRTLMRIFADDLTLWREQAKSNSALFRFDLICKIKRDNHKDFWEMAERYFGSKYIIFEFKNYSGKVTQKEVYTTVRYLYTKAMRGIAILVSPNGMDANADKACRGVLRDEGKLILSLTNDELIHMLQMKEDGEDPADFLSDKLDELLIDLEK